MGNVNPTGFSHGRLLCGLRAHRALRQFTYLNSSPQKNSSKKIYWKSNAHQFYFLIHIFELKDIHIKPKRKESSLYCKFYLQFTHSAYLTNECVQKGKIQFCWMTKTLHRKDWLKHFTTRFLRVMHWITKHYFVSSKSISKTQETCFYSFGVKMQDINKARIGCREI